MGIAHHRAKHAATRLAPAGLPEAHAEVFAAGANGTNMCQWWSARSNALTYNSSSSKLYRRES
jgi:hypothetical protein